MKDSIGLVQEIVTFCPVALPLEEVLASGDISIEIFVGEGTSSNLPETGI